MPHWSNKFGRIMAFCLCVSFTFCGMGYAHADAQLLPPKWPWHGVSMGFPEASPKDLERYSKELGINVVRLQIKARVYAQANGVSGDAALDEGMRWADAMLDECKRLGIVAVVNMSQFPIDPQLPNQRTESFWSSERDVAGVVAVTERLAKHFHDRGSEFAGYDIMSEPVLVRDGRSSVPKPWGSLLNKIVNVINQNDPNRWIVVAPGPWGGPEGYRKFSPPNASRLIWGVHVYVPHKFSSQLANPAGRSTKYPGRIGLKYWDINTLRHALSPLRQFQAKHGGVVWVGEFSAVRWSEGGEQYIKDLASIFDEQGWGWAYFSATGWHGWNPDFDNKFGDNQQMQAQLVGDKSLRWQTLYSIFKTQGRNK